MNEKKIKENSKKIDDIISNLEFMCKEIKLKINPLDAISKIVYNLWTTQIFEFLFSIKSNEIRDLNNFINEEFDINDIDNYLKVKQLIIIFKKVANYHPIINDDEDDEIKGYDPNISDEENIEEDVKTGKENRIFNKSHFPKKNENTLIKKNKKSKKM